ncbi:DUF4185 domain-containing protein [Haoranjiania flava]|uniref:DUF4185 domain-containing protein n=1 Tax=Haoranjiania flava TaxID=1856322 RepID=A0AAE3IP87_9BACT|nr:DUF4185 domain-containing protein [Haoranjiania flava]MCU7694583.1 DUF4185 domain-containing protein [Haoranjiania flava]
MKRLFFICIVATVSLLFSACGAANKIAINNVDTSSIQMINLVRIARVTGTPLPGENFPSSNNTAVKYDVGGTDLGIMWHMSGDKTGIFFGDTNGRDFVAGKGGGNGSNWRSNVLAFSEDKNLDDGLTISGMLTDEEGKAKEVAAGAKANPKVYQTSIPTGAIRANGIDYVHYMNIYEWSAPHGRWLTNFSSVYASYDDGKSWQRKQYLTFKSDSKFSQITYAKRNGYVYMLGTLAGRGAPGYLARFKEKDIENLNTYEYWNGEGKKWIRNDENAATAVIPAPLGEASLLYHEKYKRWILMYIYDYNYDANPVVKRHAIVYRDAKELTGIWSNIKVLTTSKEYPGLYSPYIHPLENSGDKIYFTMSLWSPYNVFLFRANLKLNE